jgi:putative PIG3 family NAD(P)H quinone oxidoreductase
VRAVVIERSGGPEVLTWSEVPDPVAGPGEVVVDVAASAVNRADLLQRQGHYPPPPGAPPWPGLECSGTVAEVGPEVIGWAPGDPVCALLSGGGYAERVVVPAGQLMPVPEGVDLVSAAALPEVACTVWSNVFALAGLRAGEVLLVHGGGSGIGTHAIQVARARGATVAVTAGSADRLRRCAELGASILVDYHEQDFVAEVRAATDGRGADVVLDNMGAKYLSRNVEVLATGGRLVVIGLQGGARAELDLGALMARRGSVHATTLRARPTAEKAAVVAEVVAEVWPLVASGQVRPVVDRVIAMPDAATAHAVVEGGSHVGKVLLVNPGHRDAGS